MKMTILEFINLCNEHDYDVDICSDYTDELQTNYVGDSTFEFTEVGLKRFSKVLSLEIDYTEGDSDAVVHIPEEDEGEMDECEYQVDRLFTALAGYCSVYDSDKWFSHKKG